MSVCVQRILSISHRVIPKISPTILRNSTVHNNWLTKQFYGKMSSEKPNIVFVLGAPGTGKGTQCERIVQEFGYVHLSAGELLREERQRPGSAFGEMIDDSLRQGKIVPVAVTCSLLENAMNEYIAVCIKMTLMIISLPIKMLLMNENICLNIFQADKSKNKFLIDGFPRNQDNLDGWIKQMQDKVNLKFVLVFDCTEAICVDRCLNRNIGRTDDNVESLKKRFNVFYHDSLPIIDFYDRQNIVRKIDGTPPPELVFEEVKQAFANFNAK